MTERRVTGWKQVCKGLMTELLAVMNNRVLVTDLDTRAKRLALQKLEEEEAITAEKKRKQEERKAARMAAMNGTLPVIAEANGEGTSSRQTLVMDSRPASSSQVSLGFETTQLLPSEHDSALKIVQECSSIRVTNSDVAVEDNMEGGVSIEGVDAAQTSSLNVEPPSFISEYQPAMKDMAKYDEMVSKLLHVQTAVVSHEYDSEEGKVELLGTKSFWLERRAQLVRERRAEEQRVYDENKKVYDPLSNPLFFNVGHPVSRRERIKMLKATVKDRRDNMTM